MARQIWIGTAAWAIPRGEADHFPAEGSGLSRYSAVFNCAEINSTFTKVHKPATFARWAETVPDDFRFSVKLPKLISHELKLQAADDAVARFADSVRPLGGKMGPWLLQLPPSLAYDAEVATTFFGQLRKHHPGTVVVEPRHASWFTGGVEAVLRGFDISRVAADPARVPAAARRGGAPHLAYYRLHGSPRVYYASYEPAWLAALADTVRQCRVDDIWVIFDNTASGAAAENARALQALLGAADGTGNPL